ncbi:MAG TPA: T9SS type A sorting domain-containing protein [Candidatus Kapabacteria bacterium]|nr:T9SS type A sorting domain-containing protein [Candidatus Kapabacteria bacterium]
MKKLVTLIAMMSFTLCLSLSAQSIKVLLPEQEVSGIKTQEDIISHGIVKNMTDKEVEFKIRFDVLEIAPEHALSICYNQCFDVVNNDYQVPRTYKLGPGETSEQTGDFYKIYCYPFRKISDDPIMYVGPAAGVTKIRVYFANVADESNDIFSYDVTFNVKETTGINDEPIVNNFGITNIFPNPANGSTRLELQYNDNEATPHLEVYSITGDKVFDYEVANSSKYITLDTKELANGSYFIQLVGNNKRSMNKQLIIKR